MLNWEEELAKLEDWLKEVPDVTVTEPVTRKSDYPNLVYKAANRQWNESHYKYSEQLRGDGLTKRATIKKRARALPEPLQKEFQQLLIQCNEDHQRALTGWKKHKNT